MRKILTDPCLTDSIKLSEFDKFDKQTNYQGKTQ